MADRESIQQRIDALASLERARELRDQGDYQGARAALRACMGVLPDHDEALELQQELGEPEGDRDRETFQVTDWVAEERARESGEPTNQDDLRHLLRQAIADQDHERIISLGEALLTLSTPDTMVYHEQVASSAELLVERNDPERLDIALGWADTWWRVCQDPRAKDYSRALKGRIATVAHREQQVRDALIKGSLSELMEAVHQLTSSRDRLESTATVLTAAENKLGTMQQDISASRSAIEAAIPGRINEARRLLEDLAAVEPSPENEARLAEMRSRERAVAEIHRLLEEAIEDGHFTPLSTLISRLRANGDQLSTSLHLLERAESTLAVLATEREANIKAYEGGIGTDLEQAVVALTALRRVDPDHELCTNLPKLERRLREVEQQHQDLERRLSDKDIRGVSEALRRVRTRSDRLSVTPKLVTRAERYLDEAARNERRHRNLVLSVTAGIAIALSLPLMVWLIERSAWHAALEVEDPTQRVSAIAAYRDGALTWFYGGAAALEQQRLVEQLHEQAWSDASGIQDPEARIEALRTFADEYAGTSHAREVEAAIAAAEREIDGRAFAAAHAIASPLTRIEALEGFLANQRGTAFTAAAEAAIEAARVEDDNARWQAAIADATRADTVTRLKAYLQTEGAHAAEASAMIRELERISAADEAEATERAAWARVSAASDPQARLEAVVAYLANDRFTRFRAEAVAVRKEAAAAADGQAWTVASDAAGSRDERLERLQAYLQRTMPPPDHAVEARSLISEIRRVAERERWMTASAPGPVAGRIERLRSYLEQAPAATYANDAQILLEQLEDQIDHAAYAKARSPLAPGQRVLALQAYLAGDTNLSNRDRAQHEVRLALDAIAGFPLEDIALEPVAILVQLPPTVLAQLPQDQQLRLPIETLVTLPARAQAALPLSAFSDLPPARLRAVPRSPVWCTRSGVDGDGTWADISLRGRADLRLRLIPPAEGRPPLWVAETEITQAQWGALGGSDPSEVEGPDLPVHRMRLADAQRFVTRLRSQLDFERDEPYGPRLPRSEEMRFLIATAIVGAADPFPARREPTPAEVDARAWIATNSNDTIRAVRGREADAFGLFGLFGNVAEWCLDDDRAAVIGGHYASAAANTGPDIVLDIGPDERDERVGCRVVVTARWTSAGP